MPKEERKIPSDVSIPEQEPLPKLLVDFNTRTIQYESRSGSWEATDEWRTITVLLNNLGQAVPRVRFASALSVYRNGEEVGLGEVDEHIHVASQEMKSKLGISPIQEIAGRRYKLNAQVERKTLQEVKPPAYSAEIPRKTRDKIPARSGSEGRNIRLTGDEQALIKILMATNIVPASLSKYVDIPDLNEKLRTVGFYIMPVGDKIELRKAR